LHLLDVDTSLEIYNDSETMFKFRFRFRFIRIVARKLKITKFTANKNIKIEYN